MFQALTCTDRSIDLPGPVVLQIRSDQVYAAPLTPSSDPQNARLALTASKYDNRSYVWDRVDQQTHVCTDKICELSSLKIQCKSTCPNWRFSTPATRPRCHSMKLGTQGNSLYSSTEWWLTGGTKEHKLASIIIRQAQEVQATLDDAP